MTWFCLALALASLVALIVASRMQKASIRRLAEAQDLYDRVQALCERQVVRNRMADLKPSPN